MSTLDKDAEEKRHFELTKMRFEYAWKWFDFHAEQRTKMFNFMLIGLGVLASSVVTAWKECLEKEAIAICLGAVILAAIFIVLDLRNRHLYLLADAVLVDMERDVVFDEGDPGIALRNRRESDAKTWQRKIRDGHHQYLMPGIAVLFVLLFSFLALHGLLSVDQCRKPSESPAETTAAANSTVANTPASVTSGSSLKKDVGSDAVVVGTVPMKGAWYFAGVGGGILLMLLGAWALSGKHKILGGAALVAGAVTTAMPHFSIPLSAQFTLDPKFEAKLADKMGIDVKLEQRLSEFRQSQATILAALRISGFDSGEESLDCDKGPNHENILKITSVVADAFSRQLQPVIFVIGSTDRMELSPSLRRRYESNSGLARARANAVSNCLKIANANIGSDKRIAPNIVVATSGPGYSPELSRSEAIDHEKMAEDRGVSVLVLAFPAKAR